MMMLLKHLFKNLALWSLALCATVATARPLMRSELTVCGYVGSEELTDFPVLVRISPTRISGFQYSQCAAEGADISFSADADGEELIPHEIEYWNPEGESTVWVRLPRLSGAETKFYLRWQDAKPPTCSSKDVWPDYATVLHFNSQTGGTTVRDSTLRADGTCNLEANQLLPDTSESMLSGIGLQKLGTAAIVVPDYSSLKYGSQFTASFVFKMAERKGYESIASKKVSPTYTSLGWCCQMQNSNTQLYCEGSKNKSSYGKYPLLPDVTKNWSFVTFVFDGTTMKVYNKGEPTTGYSSVDINATGEIAADLKISSFSGWIDEVRVHKGVDSADRVKADYDTLANQGFVTAAAAENIGSVIIVTGEPEEYGADQVAYGQTPGVIGKAYTYTCPAAVRIDEISHADCKGWTLVSLQDESVVRSSDDAGEDNLSCSFEFEDGVVLIWRWQKVFEWNVFTGEVDDNWFEAGNWMSKTVPTANDDVLIDGKTVVAEGSIAARRLTINGGLASLTLGKDDHSLNIAANIASNLLVTGGATLSVYPGEFDYSTVFATFADGMKANYTNANVIAIGGSFTVAAGSTVYPSNAKTSGTPVFFKAKGEVIVEEGATFDVRKRGWMWSSETPTPSGAGKPGSNGWWSFAPGLGFSWSVGAGYGGKGGNGNNTLARLSTFASKTPAVAGVLLVGLHYTVVFAASLEIFGVGCAGNVSPSRSSRIARSGFGST